MRRPCRGGHQVAVHVDVIYGDLHVLAAGQPDFRAAGGIRSDAPPSQYIGSGQQLSPLPEGFLYLGFIFARGDTPARVEGSLREAYDALQFNIEKSAD